MGIFSFFAERKIIKKVTGLLLLQKQTFSRLVFCKERGNWAGAASDARMMLEAASYIDHVFALNHQNNGLKTDYDSKFGQFEMAAFDATEAIKEEVAKALIEAPKLKDEFIVQMAKETSNWKLRMISAVEECKEELKSIGEDINKVAASA